MLTQQKKKFATQKEMGKYIPSNTIKQHYCCKIELFRHLLIKYQDSLLVFFQTLNIKWVGTARFSYTFFHGLNN